jgi:hypothetical protein
MRITTSHKGLHTNPITPLPYPLSRSVVWNTATDIPYIPHHLSISDTHLLYSALGAASTTLPLLSSSGFFSGIKGWSIVHTNRFSSHPHSSTTKSCPTCVQEPFDSSSVSMAPPAMPALRVICRYHSFYSAPFGAVKASDEPDPAPRKGCKIGSARGRVGGFEAWISKLLGI